MSRSMPPVVAVICGDPGGAAAVAPVLERLLVDTRVAVLALAYREARTVWSRRALPFRELPDGTTESDASHLLIESGAAALVAGTSVNAVDLEVKFVAAAKRLGIPSLGVLDFWSNYVERFRDPAGGSSSVPDHIAVMDERARAEMIELGFDPAGLVVTGQPAFDSLPSIRARFTDEARERIRSDLGVGAGALLVVFASQPLSVVNGSRPTDPAYLGFTEDEVLAALVRALSRVSNRGVAVVLAILPHPRQDPGVFDGLSRRPFPTAVSTQHPPLEVAMSSDLVVGMNSVLLLEACYLGCPTLSLQPGLRRPDALPTNRMGITRAVYDWSQIDSQVADLLIHEEGRRALRDGTAEFRVDGGAAGRVADLLYGLLEEGHGSRTSTPGQHEALRT